MKVIALVEIRAHYTVYNPGDMINEKIIECIKDNEVWISTGYLTRYPYKIGQDVEVKDE
jgi:hypothetical protein